MLSPAEADRSPSPLTEDDAPARGSGRTGWLFVVGGGIGLCAAFVLLVEKIALLRDPSYVPSCSINPVLSCGSIMSTWQAEVLGFPNPVLGVIGFSVLTCVGAALLAGATFARWFWVGLQGGLLLGIGFVHWLVFQSLYRIEALCPYCMVVWAVTIPLFLLGSVHIARAGHLGGGARTVAGTISARAPLVLTSWYLLILALITVQFWTYWETLVP